MESQAAESSRILRTLTVLGKNGLRLEEYQVSTLSAYVDQLHSWNSRLNLVSRKDEEHIWTSHILHSLSLLFYMELPPDIELLDLGTGGGLPGLPLAIVRPDIHVTLLDSIKKKTAAVTAMIEELPVGNVGVVTSRAEDLARMESRRFDVIVSRAVAPLTDLLKWTENLYARKRHLPIRLLRDSREVRTPLLAAYKGGALGEELLRARARFPAVALQEIPMNFPGSTEAGLEEKRLVVAVI